MRKINCLIVDDEPIARAGLKEYVAEIDCLSLTGSCRSADEAASVMRLEQIDLIFLDIEMPGLSGIQFLKTIERAPVVILTTAYTEYAVEGFNLDVMDYLLKPIAFSRFNKAVQKAVDYLHHTNQTNTSDFFFLKVNSCFEKIYYSEILFVEALQNYVSVHFNNKKMLSYIPISSLEKQLPASMFLRVHKSYLVSLLKINTLTANTVRIGSHEIPVSRKLRERLQKKLLADSLVKK